MGDRDDGARVVLQEPLEPADGLRVEMVGRLVEKEEVRLGEQQLAERDTALLAAREVGHRGIAGRTAQRVHGDLEVAVEVPRASRIDLVLQVGLLGEQLVEVGVRIAHCVADLVEPVDQPGQFGDAFLDVAHDVLVRVQLRLLREVADLEAWREAGLAGETVVDAGHDLQ